MVLFTIDFDTCKPYFLLKRAQKTRVIKSVVYNNTRFSDRRTPFGHGAKSNAHECTVNWVAPPDVKYCIVLVPMEFNIFDQNNEVKWV